MALSCAETARPSLDPRRLRSIFDRRARSFGEVDFLPREIARRMHERLDYIKVAPARVLDLGCGRGGDLALLKQRFGGADVYGFDCSARMLDLARQSNAGGASASVGWRRWLPDAWGGASRPSLIQGDFGTLPFAASSFQLLWSNLALHWHPRPERVFPEWQRALAVGGLLMFSALGPDSLIELSRAWRAVDAPRLATQEGVAITRTDNPPHVIDFVDMHDVGDMLVASGFDVPVMDMERLTVTYASPESLLRDVRCWGAYPFTAPGGWARSAQARPNGEDQSVTPAFSHAEDAANGRREGRGLGPRANLELGGRGRDAHAATPSARRALLPFLLEALARERRADGTIPLTFEIVYGHAWKAAPRVAPEGQGIVRLHDIGRSRSRA